MKNFRIFILSLTVSGFILGPSHFAMAKTQKRKHKAAAAAPAPGPSTQERLETLEQSQKILERKWELDKEAAEQKAKEAPVIGAGSEGFYIKSANGEHQLKIRGYVQLDGRFFLSDDGDKLANQFELRRVRPIVEGTIFKYYDFKIMPDFGEGKTVLQDAYFNIHPKPYVQVLGGKFKSPVGLERLQSATNILFIERGLPTNLVPNRDLGLDLHGEIWGGIFNYDLAFLDGVFDNGSLDGDTSDGKDFAGRVFVQPFKKTNITPLQGFGAGVSGTFGSQFGSAANPNLPSYKSNGQNTIFSYLSDGTAPNTTVAKGDRFRISPQGYWYWGPFGLLGEYVRSTSNVAKGTATAELTNTAWQVAASYVITGEKASYNGVVPKNPINPKKGHWGAWQIAGRFGQLDIDSGAFPTFADPTKSVRKATEWGVGVNWFLTKNFKWALNYNQTHFDGGAAGGKDRDTEQALFTRLQIAY